MFAVRLNDGPHSLMRKEEYHGKRQSEQSKSEINRRADDVNETGRSIFPGTAQALEGDVGDLLDAFLVVFF